MTLAASLAARGNEEVDSLALCVRTTSIATVNGSSPRISARAARRPCESAWGAARKLKTSASKWVIRYSRSKERQVPGSVRGTPTLLNSVKPYSINESLRPEQARRRSGGSRPRHKISHPAGRRSPCVGIADKAGTFSSAKKGPKIGGAYDLRSPDGTWSVL